MASRWDIVDVDFGVPVGHEQAKVRPAVVVSHDGLNHNADLATVCPITSARTQPKYPSEVAVPDLPGILTAGVVMAQQIRTVSISQRVRRVRGRLEDPVLRRRVYEAIAELLPPP
jgi:mRNA interferase MazF